MTIDLDKTTSPVIATWLRRWYDDLPDAGRERLEAYAPKVAGTERPDAVEDLRAWLCTDWLVRVHTPAWLELAGLKDRAGAVRALLPVLSPDSADTAGLMLSAVGAAALDAARAGAREALRPVAWQAAWTASRAAAGPAARDAGGAALRDPARAGVRDAALTAGWAAAFCAAGVAARAGAFDALFDAAVAAAAARARAAVKAAAGAAEDADDGVEDAAQMAVAIATAAVARDEERDAAGADVLDAARAGAQEALGTTVLELQAAAFQLLDSLIKVGA